MKLTGIFLPDSIYQEVMRLLEPSILVSLKKGIITTRSGDRDAVRKLITSYAAENALSVLPDGQCYGLTSNRELVRP